MTKEIFIIDQGKKIKLLNILFKMMTKMQHKSADITYIESYVYLKGIVFVCIGEFILVAASLMMVTAY